MLADPIDVFAQRQRGCIPRMTQYEEDEEDEMNSNSNSNSNSNANTNANANANANGNMGMGLARATRGSNTQQQFTTYQGPAVTMSFRN